MRILMLLAFPMLAACGPDRDCAEEALDPPATAPSKAGVGSLTLAVAQARADLHGVCRAAGDFVGQCDRDCSSLAWFCGNNELFALDCGELIMHGECVEGPTSWFCQENDPFEDDDW